MIATAESRYGTTRNNAMKAMAAAAGVVPVTMSYIFGMTPDHWTCALVFAQRPIAVFKEMMSYSMRHSAAKTISFPSMEYNFNYLKRYSLHISKIF
jgi:hypothetical protein